MEKLIRWGQPSKTNVVRPGEWIVPQMVAPSPPSTPLFIDTFTDSDDTLLTAHAPDMDTVGGGWTVHESVMVILNNGVTTSFGGNFHATVDCGNADAIVESTASAGAGTHYIYARYSDSSNSWLATLTEGKLLEKVAGVNTERADLGTPSAIPNIMSLTCNGTDITFAAETGLSATYNSATHNQNAIRYGIGGWNSNTLTHDDFSVSSL